MGSTSYLGDQSVVRPRTLFDYLSWVRSNNRHEAVAPRVQASGRLPEAGQQPGGGRLDPLDTIENIVLKRLRTSDGLDLRRDVSSRFGSEPVRAILRGAQQGMDLGLVEMHENLEDGEIEVAFDEDVNKTAGDRAVMRLSIPDGFLLSNSILSSIFAELF
jgi:oxygen-independent coproporphyrinogen-3 oxidase